MVVGPDHRLTCPLCGIPFTADPDCHRSCPLVKDCTIICCPNCHYGTPDTSRSRWARRFEKWFEKRSAKKGDGEPVLQRLSDLKVGAKGKIIFVRHERTERVNQLSALGLVPGTEIVVRQHNPSVVIEIGATILALDRSVARDLEILVESHGR